MLGKVLDVFRLRQYFDVVVRARQVATAGLRDDLQFVDLARRALVRLPFERQHGAEPADRPFPPMRRRRLGALDGRRVAVVATGGSGALASVVGVARALEECEITPSVISLCSGSALFGFPIAAGLCADEVAEFVTSLRPDDYVDVDWGALAALVPRAARGFGGLVRGDRLEETIRRRLGDMTLGELPIAAYAPIWNIEANRTEYIGPATHPSMTVARAVRMAVALPLFFAPVALDGGYWCDGGIVDIFPVHPVLDIDKDCDLALAVNGFYPPGFAGEDQTGWRDRALSIVDIASQVRTAQQAQLARENLARLQRHCDVVMLEPVDYAVVAGLGFYRQFLDTSQWPAFMRAGRESALRALEGAARVASEEAEPRARREGAVVSRTPRSARTERAAPGGRGP